MSELRSKWIHFIWKSRLNDHKRSGYKIIRQSPRSGSPSHTEGQYSEAGPSVPNAPPAYDKLSSGPMPPPYSP
uniref:Uncharacterized protein n=1 Tax=Cyclopterus lumpus TaxID=8103 RepID=A0A8C2WHX9_CYCLU